MNGFKEMLKYLRNRSGKSQQALADDLGMSKSAISMYENGQRKPNFDVLEAIADYFNVNMGTLLGDEERLPLPARNLLPIPETYQVPRVGSIACGTPTLAEQNIEGYDNVPVDVRCDFTLVCKGDSMVGAGIEDGDLVYIREQPEVENGEIAAVMVGEEDATLKRFKQVGDTVLLIPENSSYEPLVFSKEQIANIRIIGKAVGFTRFFEK